MMMLWAWTSRPAPFKLLTTGNKPFKLQESCLCVPDPVPHPEAQGTACPGGIAGGRGRILSVDGQLVSAQEAGFLSQTRKLEGAQKLQLCWANWIVTLETEQEESVNESSLMRAIFHLKRDSTRQTHFPPLPWPQDDGDDCSMFAPVISPAINANSLPGFSHPCLLLWLMLSCWEHTEHPSPRSLGSRRAETQIKVRCW